MFDAWELYQDRKKRGLCTQCGVVLPADWHKARCARCTELNRQHQSKRNARLKAAGLCLMCGVKKARPGRTMCEACAKSRTNYMREYNSRRQAVK